MHVRRLDDLSRREWSALVERSAGVEDVRDDVRDIVERVRDGGDAALRSLSRELDGVHVDDLDVTRRTVNATDRIESEVRDAIREAAANIRAFHERQLREDWRAEIGGRELGRRFRPIDSAGVYVPGGTASYPSSALMGVIPAVVAGVDHVAVATPPADELDPVTHAAIHEAGADRVYAAGGAQAIAAFAYGTETIDPVDIVAGPGNKWVAAAKAEVRGDVAIDSIAGPSEILVLADGSADPELVAADLLAQAEHDANASVVAITPAEYLAEQVVAEIDRQLDYRERSAIIRDALDSDASGVLLADSMDDAVTFAEAYAPEHLSIQAADDESLLDRIDSAGSVFLGPCTPVAAGDYASGPNHVLPTGGAARVTGGLSVDTFLRSSTVQRLDHGALSDLRETVTTLADAEGFEAHAESIEKRFED